MGFWGRLSALFAGDNSDDWSPDPMDPRFWGMESSISATGQIVTPEKVLQLDVVQAVMARLSGTISTLPLMVYERTGDPSDDVNGRRPAREHPLYKLLHRRPNARQTAQEFWAQFAGWAAFYRNAYAEIVPTPDNPIGELEPIHPTRVMKIERRADRRVYYTIRRLDGSGQDVFRDDEIFHVRMAPLTDDGLRGLAFYETSRETFGKALGVEDFGAAFFKNGSSGGDVLEHPGKFATKEDQADFIETWQKGARGGNRFKTRLALYGVKYIRGETRNNEAQFLETIKECAVKICRLWSMPPHLVGILDKATFSNIEQQSIEYVVHTLAPWIAGFEQACTRDLLIGEDQDNYFVEFNVAGLLRGDFKTRWQGYALGRQWGWLSVNTILQLENMPGIGPKGDEYLVPLNMNPAGKPAADGETTADPSDPNAPDPDEVDDNGDPKETPPNDA